MTFKVIDHCPMIGWLNKEYIEIINIIKCDIAVIYINKGIKLDCLK